MTLLLLAVVSLANPDSDLVASPLGIKHSAEFEVSEFAGPQLVPDLQAIAFGPNETLFASGPGYIRRLRDADHDGRADDVRDFVQPFPSGAMGLFAEENTLYVSDSQRLLRYRDANGDGLADGEPTVLFRVDAGGEHGLHAIRRGPDGWLYAIAGDAAHVSSDHITSDASPIREPVGGCLLRWSPDFSRCEVVAHGFRNAYDFAFAPSGDLFTYDSDNERCVGLPWYEPTRVYHVVPGAHHGWLGGRDKNIFRLPPYFPDITPPLVTLGRGSPTGVEVHAHPAFPEKYHHALFVADWTFGRVVALPLKARGATYVATPEVFLESVGSQGFAPTDLATNPKTGDLFVSIGGRGTRGAIYRVHPHTASPSLSKQGTEPVPRDLDQVDGLRVALVRGQSATDAAGLRESVELLTRSPGSVDSQTLDRFVREGLHHADPFVCRAAALLEARRRELKIGSLPNSQFPTSPPSLVWLILAHAPEDVINRCIREADLATLPLDNLLFFIRGLQLRLGDIGDPARMAAFDFLYRPRQPIRDSSIIPPSLWSLFPTAGEETNREIARLAAMVELNQPAFAQRLLDEVDRAEDPVRRVHFLMALTRLPSIEPYPASVLAVDLLTLDLLYSAAGINLDTNGIPRLRELHFALASKYPDLNRAMLASPAFGNSFTLFWTGTPGFPRREAAEKFAARYVENALGFFWDADLVELFAELPDVQAKGILRAQWGNPSVRVAVARALARNPQSVDFDRFLEALQLRDRPTTERMLQVLDQLTVPATDDRTLLFAKAILQWGREPGLADGQTKLLSIAKRIDPSSPTDLAGWQNWLKEKHPDEWKVLFAPGSWDEAGWPKRLGGIPFDAGDPDRGKLHFQRFTCQACHAGSRALGPDLAGVTKRFSREDLFRAIVEPSRDIPDRYRPTRFETLDGKIYEGIIAYEAIDGALIQQSNLETVRLRPDEIDLRSPSDRSLMPVGLLDRATDAELADLDAYLRGL